MCYVQWLKHVWPFTVGSICAKLTHSIDPSKSKRLLTTFVTGILTAWLFARFVCYRALFEKDKLLFALLLAISIQVAAGTLSPRLVQFMVTGEVTFVAGV